MSTLRLVLELLYFASGPIIAVFAFIGLKQLKIAKDNAKMTAKRESYRLAADQCTHYLAAVVPILNRLDEMLREKNIKYFDQSQVEIAGNMLKVNYKSVKTSFEQLMPVLSELVDAMNYLEGISIFFISGVADESLAFSSIGVSYCGTVRKLLPVILLVNSEGHYRNLIKLFLMWNSRLDNAKLRLDKAKIEKHLKTIENKFINPLGT